MTPSITSVAPDKGSVAGGKTVTITGSNFAGVTAVTFGGIMVSYSFVSDTMISAITPSGTAGAVSVAVVTADATGTKANAYTYIPAPVITSITPDGGPVAGGTTVSITGSNFTEVTSVTFGGTAASGISFISDDHIAVTSPSGAAGTVDVTVTTPYGTGTKTGGFIYFPKPFLGYVVPNAGPKAGGTPVTIQGTGFIHVESVRFDGTVVPYTVISDTSISVVVPAHAPGTVPVEVETLGGEDSSGTYTYLD
jgi:hypothetical protein